MTCPKEDLLAFFSVNDIAYMKFSEQQAIAMILWERNIQVLNKAEKERDRGVSDLCLFREVVTFYFTKINPSILLANLQMILK